MNDQLQQQLAEILSWLEQSAKLVGEQAMQQVPLVVEELLRWKFVESLIGFVLRLTISIALCYATKRLCQWSYRIHSEMDDMTRGLQWLTPTAAGLFSSIFLVEAINHNDWLQIWLAPRIYLLEYASTLLK